MQKILSTIKYYTDRRFSTIAGTLVYFLLMSIAPFMLWLTFVLGKADIRVPEIISSSGLFDGILPVLRYLKDAAENAASGAGIFFLLTSLYSSSNFFYHLRRSGEIVYESPRIKSGIKLRLASLALIIVSVFLIALTGGIAVIGGRLLNIVMPPVLSGVIVSIATVILAFFIALALNLFACPYKLTLKQAVPGSLITTALWLLLSAGFAVYLNLASPEKLYGKIASLIVFLLWGYVMMSCFVIGLINNRKNVSETPKKCALPLASSRNIARYSVI